MATRAGHAAVHRSRCFAGPRARRSHPTHGCVLEVRITAEGAHPLEREDAKSVEGRARCMSCCPAVVRRPCGYEWHRVEVPAGKVSTRQNPTHPIAATVPSNESASKSKRPRVAANGNGPWGRRTGHNKVAANLTDAKRAGVRSNPLAVASGWHYLVSLGHRRGTSIVHKQAAGCFPLGPAPSPGEGLVRPRAAG